MLLPKEKRDLKITYKRLMWFLIGVFVLDAFICFLFLTYTSLNKILCGFIIICITSVLYLLFLFICAKIDKKKKEKLEKSGKKDPFSHN